MAPPRLKLGSASARHRVGSALPAAPCTAATTNGSTSRPRSRALGRTGPTVATSAVTTPPTRLAQGGWPPLHEHLLQLYSCTAPRRAANRPGRAGRSARRSAPAASMIPNVRSRCPPASYLGRARRSASLAGRLARRRPPPQEPQGVVERPARHRLHDSVYRRCSTRSRSCRRATFSPGAARPALRRSTTVTRLAPLRRVEALNLRGLAAARHFSGPCPCCSAGSPTRPGRTRGCSAFRQVGEAPGRDP